MIAIVTGDIINSESSKAETWMPLLKNQLLKFGKTPEDWEIYRGDEFQIKTTPEKALELSLLLKAKFKTITSLDVRLGIGIGNEAFRGKSISESNGTAYKNSGRVFETLKEQKRTIAIKTESINKDETLNLMLKLALDFMDNWSTVSAEIIYLALENPEMQQQELATILGIQQSAVSQRKKRARLSLVQEVLTYYSSTINNQ
ncbi:MAG: SatD family protein [Cellulophaga sp.]|nr:SatD family protein [Cellulophaga sp.]